MQQELRELPQTTYANRHAALVHMRSLWPATTDVTADDVARWRTEGRP